MLTLIFASNHNQINVPVYRKDLSLLQKSSILKQINLIHEKKKHIHFLQKVIVQKKIEEKILQPFVQRKIWEL